MMPRRIIVLAAALIASALLLYVLLSRNAKSNVQKAMPALATKDRRAISQALSDLIYSGNWTRDQAILILRTFLKDTDPWIRLQAAERLYIIGNKEGCGALVEIISNKLPMLERSAAYTSGDFDLRVRAAEIVGQFRDHKAAGALVGLYNETHNLTLLDELAKVGAPEAINAIKEASHNQPSDELMELYGIAHAQSEADFIAGVYASDTYDVRTRLAAAWASCQLRDDPNAARLIRDFVGARIESNGGDATALRRAIRYLGSLEDAASIRQLEQVALQCDDVELVRIATVNLVLNHSQDSIIGRQLVADELTKKPNKIGLDLAIKLAAASGDSQLKKTGETFDKSREGERIWKQQGVARVSWSIWGWADDYLLVPPHLNRVDFNN
jgi:hypothetical protein